MNLLLLPYLLIKNSPGGVTSLFDALDVPPRFAKPTHVYQQVCKIFLPMYEKVVTFFTHL